MFIDLCFFYNLREFVRSFCIYMLSLGTLFFCLTFPGPYCNIVMFAVRTHICASGSVGGARPCQGRGRGFESRLALLQKEKDTQRGILLFLQEHFKSRRDDMPGAPLGARGVTLAPVSRSLIILRVTYLQKFCCINLYSSQ